jgi:type IV pilus assembly protein PilW
MSRSLRSRGFSLVELMVAMALGLVIVGGVISVLMANKRSYRANEGLAQVQETARSAYELIARDVRQSGTTGCDNARKMTNVLTNAGTNWWEAWEGVHGFDNGEADSAVTSGSAAGQRDSTTDSLRLRGIDGLGFPIESHNATSGNITLQTANSTTTSLASNDYLIICDFDHSTMFKGGTWAGSTRVMPYSTGTGNCVAGLGFPSTCASSLTYTFQRNAWIGRLGASDWYVGTNPRGGKSLYRKRLTNGGATPVATEEIIAGVTDMQIKYGVNGSDTIADASAVAAADWAKVNSVFITLTIDSSDTNISTDSATNSGKLRRTYTYIITMRNRVT